MESVLADLLDKVKAVAQGPNRDLLRRLVDLLYQQELEKEEYFSPEDLADIEAGFEEIKRGEFITWEEFKRKQGL
jgi:predicted transcriptional regulator